MAAWKERERQTDPPVGGSGRKGQTSLERARERGWEGRSGGHRVGGAWGRS